MNIAGWILVGILAVVAGLLSAVEAALLGVSPARAEEFLDESRVGARALRDVLETREQHLDAVLFVRTTAQVAALVLTTLFTLSGTSQIWVVTVVILLASAVMYVLVDAAPRSLGRDYAERVALLTAGPIGWLTGFLGPLSRLLLLVGRLLTLGRAASGPFASEAELRELVDLAERSSVIESGERAMIHGVFELGDTMVREVMVPRTDVVFIERHKTLRQAMSLFLRSGYSRLPVTGAGIDDVVGFAYLKDISKRVYDRADAQTTEKVESLMRPVLHVPDSKPVDGLLRDMQAARRHIAVVVDEYGGTAGLVTIEDVLEEIVGEIADEFDAREIDVVVLEPGLARVPARFPVDDLDELDGFQELELDDDLTADVDSVGGLMAKHLGLVPIPGSKVTVGPLQLTAEEGTVGRRKQIATVLVRYVRSTADSLDSGE